MTALSQELDRCTADVRAMPTQVQRMRALTFEAWRLPDDGQDRRQRFGVKPPVECKWGGQGYPLELPPCESLREAVDHAALGCQHKDHFVVVERHAGQRKAIAHFYAVKQESKPSYRTTTGVRTAGSEAYHKRYWQHLFDLAVDALEPRMPADVLADPVGRDLTLVEG